MGGMSQPWNHLLRLTFGLTAVAGSYHLMLDAPIHEMMHCEIGYLTGYDKPCWSVVFPQSEGRWACSMAAEADGPFCVDASTAPPSYYVLPNRTTGSAWTTGTRWWCCLLYTSPSPRD